MSEVSRTANTCTDEEELDKKHNEWDESTQQYEVQNDCNSLCRYSSDRWYKSQHTFCYVLSSTIECPQLYTTDEPFKTIPDKQIRKLTLGSKHDQVP